MSNQVDLDGIGRKLDGSEEISYEDVAPKGGDRKTGKRVVRGPRAEVIFLSGRTFGSFFGKALTTAGSRAVLICFIALVSAWYQLRSLDNPGVRQLVPGMLLGVVVVVLVYSLWLWAYRHNDKGTTLGTVIAYALFVLSLAILGVLWVLYPLLSVGVALAFAVSSLVVSLAARKHGENEYKRGRQDATAEMTALFDGLQSSLVMAEQLSSTIGLAARATVQASEQVNASSAEVATAAAGTKAALARAEHIRDNLDTEVQRRAKELVPENVAKLEGEAAQRHARELAEAHQAGRHEADGQMASLRQELAELAALVPLLPVFKALKDARILDDQGNIMVSVQQPQPYVPGSGPIVRG